MRIKSNIEYIGVDDNTIDLFEGMYKVPNGMSYNSYVILDDKIAVLDTVDKNFKNEWFENLQKSLDGREPDYLIVQHMEPDHSANVSEFMLKYPSAKIVSSSKSFAMMKNYFKTDYLDSQIVINDGDTLNLGMHTLKFITAPMVHWPEVFFTYDETDNVLFSADAFGKFGALNYNDEWDCEARRYYFGIVGKFGVQVQNVIKKLSTLKIEVICPLHGPILNDNIERYINLYNVWSSYGVESEGVVIAYTSVYGNTKKAVELLADELKQGGLGKVVINDLARCDMAEAVEDAFRYGKIVFASTTYNGDVFPFMRDFITRLTERNFQNKTVAFIENGSWVPTAAKVMKSMLETCKNINFIDASVKIYSALSDENYAQISTLAKEILQ